MQPSADQPHKRSEPPPTSPTSRPQEPPTRAAHKSSAQERLACPSPFRAHDSFHIPAFFDLVSCAQIKFHIHLK